MTALNTKITTSTLPFIIEDKSNGSNVLIFRQNHNDEEKEEERTPASCPAESSYQLIT